MKKYKNIRTGVVVGFLSDVSGTSWVEVDETLKEDVTEVGETEEVLAGEETASDLEEEVEEILLPDMTIKELRAFAEENGIEIPDDVTKKDDIIQVIAQAFEG